MKKQRERKKLYSVFVKATGNAIEVYKHVSGSFVDFADCSTTYKETELEFQD